MRNVDVSVVIPSYNSEKTIGKTLDSIVNQQTEYNFEVLVIDDGSFDDTINIVKEYVENHDNISLFFQRHKFQAEARNRGIEYAQGEYLMFADADDQYRPGYIDIMMQSIENKKLVISGIQKDFSNGKTEIEDCSILEKSTSNEQLIGNYLTKNKEMDVGLWNKIFRLDIIKKNNIMMSNENYFEDSLFILKYLLKIDFNEIKYVGTPGYILNKHVGSTTNSYDSSLLIKCESYIKKVCNIVCDNNSLNCYFNAFKARTYLFYIHRSILNNPLWDKEKQKDVLKRINLKDAVKKLSFKYSTAIVLADLFPEKYIKAYSKKNKTF